MEAATVRKMVMSNFIFATEICYIQTSKERVLLYEKTTTRNGSPIVAMEATDMVPTRATTYHKSIQCCWN